MRQRGAHVQFTLLKSAQTCSQMAAFWHNDVCGVCALVLNRFSFLCFFNTLHIFVPSFKFVIKIK